MGTKFPKVQKRMGLTIKDSKTGPRITGNVKWQDIDGIIEGYILEYVICETCGNPETEIEKGCKACGY